MRLSDIAARIAASDGAPADEYLTRLRNPTFKALLGGEPGRGRTSPAEYGETEMARARLLLAAQEVGLTAPDLAEINAAMNGPVTSPGTHPESARTKGGWSYPSALAAIIRGARAGEEWILTVRVTRTTDGTRRVSPWIHWAGWPHEEGRAQRTLDMLHGERRLATLTIPASALLAPLLGAAE